MPTIKVDIEKVKQLDAQLERLPNSIGRTASTVKSVRTALDWDIACEASIDRKLRDIAQRLDRCYTRMQQTAIFVGNAVDQYSQVETDNAEIFNTSEIFNTWKAFWSGELENSEKGTVWAKVSEDGESFIEVLTGENSASSKPKYGTYKNKSILGDADHLNVNIRQEEIKDDEKQFNPDEKWYSKAATILEGKFGLKSEGSVLDGRLAGGNNWAEGSVEGKIITGEIYTEVAAGLYVYTKDKEGNTQKIFSPGVSAEVGGSFAVVDVEAGGRIGLGEDKNMLGLYGNVDGEVLSTEGKIKMAINNKELHGEARAEANLAKVSASGGVSVLGTDLGVSGSLKVGVGAHLDVGITDDTFKIDIGAAVGVGVDLGIEIDISGTVDAVCEFATSAWDYISNTWNDASD